MNADAHAAYPHPPLLWRCSALGYGKRAIPLHVLQRRNSGATHPFTFSRGVNSRFSLLERESTYGGFSAIRVCALQRRNSGGVTLEACNSGRASAVRLSVTTCNVTVLVLVQKLTHCFSGIVSSFVWVLFWFLRLLYRPFSSFLRIGMVWIFSTRSYYQF